MFQNIKDKIKFKLYDILEGKRPLYYYEKKGVHFIKEDGKEWIKPIIEPITVEGDYSQIYMHSNSVLRKGCFLLARVRIELGENSTVAYGSTILTGANPHGPRNLLARIYEKKRAPVIIEDNVWVGARAIILTGVTIGRCSVVAAGSLVNRDVPPYSVVAGVPAKVVKQLDPAIFEG
jgi:acetyltransferase-like isoleucine patch superfamily enzyme